MGGTLALYSEVRQAVGPLMRRPTRFATVD
jgi:hypothetical protein